jgi:hypothetical protein
MAERLLLDFGEQRDFQQVTVYADANPYHIM